MSQHIQLALSEAASHHNQRLFSDYFLDHMLPNEEPWREEWRQMREEAAPIMAQLQQLYAHFVPSSNEAQTEDDWIKPVLAALGHTFEVQALLRTPDGTKRPDYIFYRDENARLAHKNALLTDELPRQGAIAVGDAKSWDRPLDQTLHVSAGTNNRGSDPFTNKNPSFQIFFYMLHSGLPWGILTNGRLWRLYALKAHINSISTMKSIYPRCWRPTTAKNSCISSPSSAAPPLNRVWEY